MRCAFLLLCMLLYGAASAQHSSLPFHQMVRSEVSLPLSAGKQVLRLYDTPAGPAAVTRHGIFHRTANGWAGKPDDEVWAAATKDAVGIIWLAAQTKIKSEAGREIRVPAMKDTVLCLFWENAQTLHLGTTGGLYTWTGKWEQQELLKGFRVNDIIADAAENLWVATHNGLWRKQGKQWVNFDETLMAEAHDRTYFALATTNDGKDLVFSSPIAVGSIAADGNHWIWRSVDGLPYGPVSRIYIKGPGYWMATSKGVIHRDTAWHYYNGLRWLPSPVVNDVLQVAPGITWVATSSGISELRSEPMILLQKAIHYDTVIEKRHNRRGLINISKLSVPGDLSTSYTENEDNDGLWTACYLAAQCYRYAVTKASDAREKAVRTFEALERLETVTGIAGYPARSYAAAEDKIVPSRSPHPKHWHISPDGKWQWLDDTSSDEITGHIYTLSLFYELVADEAQKQRVKSLIDRIVSYIIDNDFHLIDYDGKPTRWGIWHPDSLNHSPNWMYEKGLNALQVLSFLKTARYYTGNPKYETAYLRLAHDHGYVNNAVEAKICGPFETSHSDDILNFFPYYGLFHHTANDPYRPLFIKSLERTWQNVRSDRMPVWNVIASSLLKRDCDLDIALTELQQYPLDLVDWSMENSHRWDLLKDPMVDRGRRMQAVHPIPTPESSVSRWNTNPKRLDSGRRGETEETGTYFLFAYWMGKYHGYWE